MKLIDELHEEHTLIDRVLGSFRSWVELRMKGEGEASEGPLFFEFFRKVAGDFHHAREEDSLFAALHTVAELPLDRGPMFALKEDHHRLAAVLDLLEPLLRAGSTDPALRAHATTYSRGLWTHIDAENSVLFSESEMRLARHHVKELPSRPMTELEAAARVQGERLATQYPNFDDRGVMRGEGCIICSSYGVNCRGLEREWWNDWEWEEHPNRSTSG